MGYARLIAVAMAVTAGCGGSSGNTDGGTGAGGTGGGGSGTASCTLTQSGGGSTLTLCQEASGLPPAGVEQFRQGCMVPPDAGAAGTEARFSNGPCSRTGALGGCQITAAGTSVTNWYYEDANGLLTPADIMTLCAGIGTFVPA